MRGLWSLNVDLDEPHGADRLTMPYTMMAAAVAYF